jgi:hypothetical protein
MSLTKQQKRFYVYAYRIDGRMAYVGKGTGNRAWVHLNSARNPILKARIAKGNRVVVRILKAGLTEVEAFRLERVCINKWGYTLCNIASGTRTATEAAWHECLHDLQHKIIGYGEAIRKPSRTLVDLSTGKTQEADSIVLRIRNLAWIRRQYRQLMRSIERAHPDLIS